MQRASSRPRLRRDPLHGCNGISSFLLSLPAFTTAFMARLFGGCRRLGGRHANSLRKRSPVAQSRSPLWLPSLQQRELHVKEPQPR
ncbi:hypothetical protein MTO96_008776 [Rhipicephalus appendiculatus]